ncbi:hydroxyethylthiazole kinase [Amphibacillus sp. MSJ-3]|uniref:hydroxyethylthiazole kinase n=1 Tax=Amphibacillus sp. MSJ-3 TaxID=2841505 RepID=UPI001C0F3B4C|nr:hydroxyethylthiazole kinase [Amphibacillus sp. MSJ-3]MBU5594720.1 hydroxyethylthiazole kinase [Amphibacillus sp. MSJ-3]
MKRAIYDSIVKVKQKQPLIHNITNQVVMNFTANGLYALGALPIMASDRQEVAEMVCNSDALVLNIGTLTEELLESMLIAGEAANKHGIPVVLDPVAVGATQFRSKSANRILSEVEVSLIRGNAAEISHLAGLKTVMRGVDSTEKLDHLNIIRRSIDKLSAPLLMTGEIDYVADGERIICVKNGTDLLTKVTGTGCLLSAVSAAFLAVNESAINAVTAAVSYYTVAAEKAAEITNLPGQFQIAFLDALDETSISDVSQRLNLVELGEGL